MKKILLSLCLFAPLFGWAQNTELKRSCVFDFTNPLQLIPSVTPGTEAGDYVSVTDSIFRSADGLVQISFSRTSSSLGVGFMTDYDWTGNKPFLQISSGGRIIISSQNGFLHSINVDEKSIIGDLFQVKPTFTDTYDKMGHWNANDHQGIDVVEFLNSGYPSEFRVLTVDYELRADTLHPVEVNPIPGSYVYSFDQLSLTYSDSLKLLSSSGATIRNSDGSEIIDLVASVKDSVLTLSVPSTITKWDTYIINIPKGIVGNKLGFTNAELSYPINIVEAFNTFLLESTDPAEGVVSSIGPNITLTFSGVVGGWRIDEGTEIQIFNKKGEKKRTAHIIDRGDSDNNVIAAFDNGLPVLTTKDVYTMVIPEGLVYDINFKENEDDRGTTSSRATYNPETTIEYNLGGLVFPSDEVLASAKKLLAYEGVGYPTKDSKSRLVLQAMVDSEIGSDEKFNDSIAAYIMEKQIELPQTGKWYRIEGVSSNDGKVYLASRNDSIVLTKELKEAASFKATLNEDSTVVFMTMDSLYLHQLQSQDIYKGTTKRNATMKYDAEVNNLTLEHLSIEGVDSLQSFGKMTIFGSLGKNLNNEEKKAYALVDVVKGSVETNWEYAPKYEEALTSAFRIVQTDKPIPVLNYSIDPTPGSEIDTLQYVKVKFLTDSLVTIAEDAVATDLVGQSNLIRSSSIEPVEEEANTFRIRFDDVPAGKSTVTIPKGTFLFVDEGRTLPAEEMTAVYQVKESMDIQYDLLVIMPFYIIGANQGMKWFRDVDLGNLIIHTNRPYVFGISDKKVNIVQILTGREEVVLTGHFENIINFAEPGFEGCGALRLVLDKDIKEVDIKPGQYLFDIFEGTFGDDNFAKYLANPLSVSKKQCHANRAFFLDIMIDNEKATAGIRHISIDDQADKVYDLMGRRIGSDVKPGIYVKNGKKVVVK